MIAKVKCLKDQDYLTWSKIIFDHFGARFFGDILNQPDLSTTSSQVLDHENGTKQRSIKIETKTSLSQYSYTNLEASPGIIGELVVEFSDKNEYSVGKSKENRYLHFM